MYRFLRTRRCGAVDHKSVFAEFAACLICLIGRQRALRATGRRAGRAPRFRVVP